MQSLLPDSKILLILSSVLFVLFVPVAHSEVYVPTGEYIGYYDSNGVYTVIGNIKNNLDHGILPTITVSVIDHNTRLAQTIQHVPLGPYSEIPFKLKFPDVQSTRPVLVPADVSFQYAAQDTIPLQVLYDQTLITHKDGHLTGRIQNTGDQTIHNPKIFAIVHGHDDILDVTQNIEFIPEIRPGEIVNFTMYPDPSITEPILYYSCFAPTDTTVVPITTKKEGQKYSFRYDSGSWFYNATFDDTGTVMSIRGYNSYPFETYANFEFAPISGDEIFEVTFNDEPIEFIQSRDELGFWHVAYTVQPRSQGVLAISGFDKGIPPELSRIPAWIKESAGSWANGEISDNEFLEGIDYMFEQRILSVTRDIVPQLEWSIPSWVTQPAGWWSNDMITDEAFIEIITYLVEQGLVVI